MTTMKSSVVISVAIRYYKRIVWKVIRRLYMRESDILAGNVIIKLLQSIHLLNIKGQYMKESDTLAFYVENNFQRRELFQNT